MEHKDLINKLITKNCPKCGRKLIIRKNKYEGSLFVGCTNYPECKYTEELSEEFIMRLYGQKGFIYNYPQYSSLIRRREDLKVNKTKDLNF